MLPCAQMTSKCGKNKKVATRNNAKAGLCPAFAHFGEDEKKSFDVIYYLYKMKQFHWLPMRSKELWLVEKNYATVKPDSSVAPREMKTYSERRIDLRNLKILKKMLEKSSQFLSSEQPCEPKSLDVALKIAGVEKMPSENIRWVRTTYRLLDLSFKWKERKWRWRFLSSVVGDSEAVWYSVGDTD